MKTLSRALLVAASLVLVSVGVASSQTVLSLDGEYKGTLVCAQLSQLPGQAAVIRVPLDMIVTDNTVTFARPILNGTQVINMLRDIGTERRVPIGRADRHRHDGAWRVINVGRSFRCRR